MEAKLASAVAVLDERAAAIEGAQAEARARARLRSDPPRRLRMVSAHEAGHAIAAIAAGRTVAGALIRDDGSGVCWIEPGPHGADTIAAAGAAASRMAGQLGARPSPADALTSSGSARPSLKGSYL